MNNSLMNFRPQKNLSSQGQVVQLLCDAYRGMPEKSTNQPCQYRFGCFCTNTPEPQKKLLKVDDERCQACLQAMKNKALQDEGAEALQTLFDYCHVPESSRSDPFYKWASILDFYDNSVTNVRVDIEEFKKTPIGDILSENEALKKDLSTLTIEKTTLENDNTYLKGELEKLKHTPVYEKNAWLQVELQKSNQKITLLEAQLERQKPEVKTYMYQQGNRQ